MVQVLTLPWLWPTAAGPGRSAWKNLLWCQSLQSPCPLPSTIQPCLPATTSKSPWKETCLWAEGQRNWVWLTSSLSHTSGIANEATSQFSTLRGLPHAWLWSGTALPHCAVTWHSLNLFHSTIQCIRGVHSTNYKSPTAVDLAVSIGTLLYLPTHRYLDHT